jgi:NADPH oxidase 5
LSLPNRGLEISPGYVANNAPRLVSYAVFALFNLGLFAWAAHLYAASGPWVQLARGCGAIINFNAAFCLLPMMRLFISRVRRTRFARFLALEDSVDFHMLSGHTMFGAAIVHTAAYLVLYGPKSTRPLWVNLTHTIASRTGCALILIFLVLWVFALERFRKRWRFEAFLATHFLGIAIALLLLVHSPHYWKWFLVGGCGYLADRAVRFYRMRHPSHLTSVRILPSQVTELSIARPEAWKYRAGDFVFVLVPAVSAFEWHPFTISSHPERESSFTLHVRTLGDWTTRLHRDAASLGGAPVYIDGPHGAPANDILSSRVAVLVAAGIGVTPFASILRSLMHRRREGNAATLELQRVYFIWINRDQYAFEWFTEMLAELKSEDGSGLFDLRLFVTDAPPGPLPPFTEQGRPAWQKELSRIASAHAASEVCLFYCGPRGLARTLDQRCRTLGWRFKEEHF